MEVINRLTGIGSGIYYQAIPALIDPLLPGNPGGGNTDSAHQFSIRFIRLRQTGYMLLRDNQYMNRGPGIDIPECQYLIILKDNIRRNISIYNFAEKTGHLITLYITYKLRGIVDNNKRNDRCF